MPLPKKLKHKLLIPEKLKRKLLASSQMWRKTDGWTDRGNSICPFHHSLNGGGIKTTQANQQTKKKKKMKENTHTQKKPEKGIHTICLKRTHINNNHNLR